MKLLPLLALLAAPGLIHAQPQPPTAAPTLAPGDPAPPFHVEAFLKGDPVAKFEPGRVYVVEFWATWCGPCIQGMPRLSQLQSLYRERGVTVIGADIREMRRAGPGWEEVFDDQTRADVEAFVKEQGDRMAYTVAYDGAARAADTAWMKASGSEGIPTAFIVDRSGRIAWIGHPMVLRMPLDEIVAGTWDAATGPARVKQAEDAYLGAMRLFPTDAQAGLAAWDAAAAQYPVLAADLLAPKFDALIAAGQEDAAYAAGRVLLEEARKLGDAASLNRLAWSIVNPAAKLSRRDLDLAMRAAARANELTGHKDAGMLDTLARVHFTRGEVDRAVELQAAAVAAAPEVKRGPLAATLDEYKKSRR